MNCMNKCRPYTNVALQFNVVQIPNFFILDEWPADDDEEEVNLPDLKTLAHNTCCYLCRYIVRQEVRRITAKGLSDLTSLAQHLCCYLCGYIKERQTHYWKILA